MDAYFLNLVSHDFRRQIVTLLSSYKGLVAHNDILKIYRIIQYFKNIFKCNMVKNIFKIKTFFDFIHYAEIIFLSKTQWNLTCAEYVLLFFELHDVKAERSMNL